MSAEKLFKSVVLLSIFCVIVCFMTNSMALAQTWQALPPYDFLWPLWSTALSRIDPVSGLRTPIVTELTSGTILPIQPGIAWNPIFDYPYLLYNSPIGLQYYDIVYGINPWPPSYVLDPVTGGPISINPPVGYAFLPPTDSAWIQTNVPIANLAFLAEYPALALAAYTAGLPPNLTGLDPWLASLVYPTPAFSTLLTPAQILGYVPVAIPPTAVAPVPPPTLIAPPPTAVVPAPTIVTPAPAPFTPIPLSVLFPPATALVSPFPAIQPVVPLPTAAFPAATAIAPPAVAAPVPVAPPPGPTIITLPTGGNVIVVI